MIKVGILYLGVEHNSSFSHDTFALLLENTVIYRVTI